MLLYHKWHNIQLRTALQALNTHNKRGVVDTGGLLVFILKYQDDCIPYMELNSDVSFMFIYINIVYIAHNWTVPECSALWDYWIVLEYYSTSTPVLVSVQFSFLFATIEILVQFQNWRCTVVLHNQLLRTTLYRSTKWMMEFRPLQMNEFVCALNSTVELVLYCSIQFVLVLGNVDGGRNLQHVPCTPSTSTPEHTYTPYR